MSMTRNIGLGVLAMFAAVTVASAPAAAQQQAKPNIVFIMGDDIGWMQPGVYHRGLMVGETPNIDRIGNEGAIFMTYYAEQSCTAGRNAFFTGMNPLCTGMIPPQLPGSPSYLRPGSSGCRRSANDGLPDTATSRAGVQIRRHCQEHDLQGRGPADARAIEGCRRG